MERGLPRRRQDVLRPGQAVPPVTPTGARSTDPPPTPVAESPINRIPAGRAHMGHDHWQRGPAPANASVHSDRGRPQRHRQDDAHSTHTQSHQTAVPSRTPRAGAWRPRGRPTPARRSASSRSNLFSLLLRARVTAARRPSGRAECVDRCCLDKTRDRPCEVTVGGD